MCCLKLSLNSPPPSLAQIVMDAPGQDAIIEAEL
jgi:hypothetical protein